MKKEKIPIYDICSLAKDMGRPGDLLVERFGDYLNRHSQSLRQPHRHSFYHLVLFTKGAGTHIIDFSQFKVKPFDIYFMIPGQMHSWHFEGRTDGYIINFPEHLFRFFLSDPDYLERFHFFRGPGDKSVCQLPVVIRKKIVQLFEELLAYANERTPDTDMIRVLLIQLFILIENNCSNTDKKGVPQQKQVLLRSFRKLIDQHYLMVKLPKEYADLLYVTANHLNALCQDLLGKTAGELIRERVLLEAKRLLTNADMTISEIAFKLNFQDNSYFNRYFKKYEGITPAEFKKQFVTH